MLSTGALTGEDITSPLISDYFSNDTATLFSSISGRKRSYSMPEIPEMPDSLFNSMRQRRYSFTPEYPNLDLMSRVGPLLPIANLNSYKKTYLSQALGSLN